MASTGQGGDDQHEITWSPSATSSFLGTTEEDGRRAYMALGMLVYQEPEMQCNTEDNEKLQRKSEQGTNVIQFAFEKKNYGSHEGGKLGPGWR